MYTKKLKRVTALLLALCMTFILSSAAMAASGYAVKINGVTYDGAEVTTAELTVRTAGEYTVYAAVYEDNALAEVRSKTDTLSQGSDITVPFDEPLDFDSETQMLRVYIFSATGTGIKPVAAAYTYDIPVDDNYEEAASGSGTIVLKNDSIDISSVTTGAAELDEAGTTVTIVLPGTYTVQGTLDDGQIAVNYTAVEATDTVEITLDGASVTNSSGYAFSGLGGAVTLASKKNTTSSFTSSAADAVYSVDDIEIKGSGTLNVTSTAGNGIRSKENVEIGKGTLNVNASTNGIRGDEEVKLTKKCGTVTIVSGGDGITSDNAPTIKKPSKTGVVIINGGDIDITTSTYTNKSGETKNGDGIQADTLLTIANNPTININATGEALKSNFSHLDLIDDSGYSDVEEALAEGDGRIIITGGTIKASAGEDGIKAVKSVEISEGVVENNDGTTTTTTPEVTITKAADGIQVKEIIYNDEAETDVRDYVEGSVTISGGTLDITSSEDGIQCGTGDIDITGGDITVKSGNDGIQAEYTLYITDGEFDITTNGGAKGSSTTDSCKGLKAGELIRIDGGGFTMNTYDDAIHTNHTVRINGGSYEIATGDDGIHGDYYLYVNDGDINITSCYEGLEAAKVYLNGGTSRVNSTDDGVNAASKYKEEPTEAALDISAASVSSIPEVTIMANTPSGGPGGDNSGRTPPGGNGGGNGGQNHGMEEDGWGYLEINGGYSYVTTSQGDGFDSNGDVVLNGGIVIIDGATLGSEDGLDFSGGVTFNKGFVFTMTNGGMDGISGTYSQKYLTYGFSSGMGGNSGTSIQTGNYCIVDSNNNILCAFTRSKGSFGRVLLTSPQVGSGTYYIKPLNVSGAVATDSLYGTIDSETYKFTAASGCSVGSGTSYTMTVK